MTTSRSGLGAASALSVLLAVGLGGCADTGALPADGGNPTDATKTDLTGLKSLRISPPDAVIYVDANKAVTQAYQAIGKFADGKERDITSQTTFDVDDFWVGVFKGAVFTSATSQGGKTTVRASTKVGVSGSTTVTVKIRSSFTTKGVPADVAKAFPDDTTPTTGREPKVVYPPNGVLIPPNLLELEFQWLPGSGNDLFELSLSNNGADLRIYTTCHKVGAGCGYLPDAKVWGAIVAAFRNGDPAEIRVRGTDNATRKAVGVSSKVEMSVAKEDIIGGLYYWNAMPGNIIRYDFGKPAQKPVLFYTAADAKAIFCVGCHALSRNGKRMAVGLDMPAPAPLKILDVASRKVLSAGAANFMSFSPDGSQIITSDGNSLVLRDAATHKVIGPNPLIKNGTMPDWSQNGERVVYAAAKSALPIPVGRPGVDQASLMLLAYDKVSKKWLGPNPLVKTSGENNYYPTFSPDNRLVVFNRSSGSSYDAPDASLWIIAANGKGKPQRLVAADGGTKQGNSWPKFGPFVQTYRKRKLMWITFSSRRDYGLRLQGKRRAQLWMAAIDPDKAELATDPSAAAFWLPVQDINTGNHIAQWTEKVVKKSCKIPTDCPAGEFCEKGLCERRIN